MYFRQWLHDEHSCASYLVGCPTHDVVAVVDPQGDLERYRAVAGQNSMTITHVIDTHIHADHVSVARPLAVAVGAPLYMGSGAEVGFDFAAMDDGDVIDVGNRRIRVLHTPGHTPEHVSLVVDDWFVLTGDTLFVGDVGRVDLALAELDEAELRGRAKELYHSLQSLLELRDDVEVYPGHYDGSACGRGMDGKAISTIGRERRTNEALNKDIDSFIEFQLHEIPPLPDDFAEIKRANVGR